MILWIGLCEQAVECLDEGGVALCPCQALAYGHQLLRYLFQFQESLPCDRHGGLSVGTFTKALPVAGGSSEMIHHLLPEPIFEDLLTAIDIWVSLGDFQYVAHPLPDLELDFDWKRTEIVFSEYILE